MFGVDCLDALSVYQAALHGTNFEISLLGSDQFNSIDFITPFLSSLPGDFKPLLSSRNIQAKWLMLISRSISRERIT